MITALFLTLASVCSPGNCQQAANTSHSPQIFLYPASTSPAASTASAGKAQGASGLVISALWKHIEPQRRRLNWTFLRQSVTQTKQAKLKPIIVWNVTHAEQLPTWYAGKFGSQGLVRIGDGKTLGEQSFWNSTFRQHTIDLLQSFRKQFAKTPPEMLLFEMPSLPQEKNDGTDFWGGDPFAAESFRLWLIRKYGGNSPLRDAWGEFHNVNTVLPFTQAEAPNEQAWLDLTAWYAASQTEWARLLLTQSRPGMPLGRVALRLKPRLRPETGTDWAALAKLSAQSVGAVCFVVPADAESLPLLYNLANEARKTRSDCRILLDLTETRLPAAQIFAALPDVPISAVLVKAGDRATIRAARSWRSSSSKRLNP
jgi:hypothetical protein